MGLREVQGAEGAGRGEPGRERGPYAHRVQRHRCRGCGARRLQRDKGAEEYSRYSIAEKEAAREEGPRGRGRCLGQGVRGGPPEGSGRFRREAAAEGAQEGEKGAK